MVMCKLWCKRLFSFMLISVVLMVGVFGTAVRAKAFVIAIPAAELAVGATFLVAAGVVFVSTGDAQKATESFLQNNAEARQICKELTAETVDGILKLTSSVRDKVKTLLDDIKTYFAPAESGGISTVKFGGDVKFSVLDVGVFDTFADSPVSFDTYTSAGLQTQYIGTFDFSKSENRAPLTSSDYFDISGLNDSVKSTFAFLSDVSPYDYVDTCPSSYLGAYDETIDPYSLSTHYRCPMAVYAVGPFFTPPQILSPSVITHNGVDYYEGDCYFGYVLEDLSTNLCRFICNGFTTGDVHHAVLYPVSGDSVISGDAQDIPYSKDSLYNGTDVQTAIDDSLADDAASVPINVGAVSDALAGDSTADWSVTQDDVLDDSITDNLTANPDTPIDTPTDDVDLSGFAVPDLSGKFPFCLPFDLLHLVSALNVKSEVPVFTIPINMDFVGYNSEFVIDLTDWEPVATAVRWGVTLVFILGLILITRKLIG